MKRFWVLLLFAFPLSGFPQEKTETREMVGKLGSRGTLLVLHSIQRADGSWHMTGEYIMLGTLTRRFLEGERGPELGVTTLKEGTSAILFGRPATGELRGTLRGAPGAGMFKGTRFGPGGQERERFEFSEEFPAMAGYTASVACDTADGRYTTSLAYAVEAGKLKSFEWLSKVGPNGHTCRVSATEQRAMKDGLRFAAQAGRCAVTLRELGEFVMVSAQECAAQCGSEAYLESMLVDRRGRCSLLRPEAR
jgi:hypothetical protein